VMKKEYKITTRSFLKEGGAYILVLLIFLYTLYRLDFDWSDLSRRDAFILIVLAILVLAILAVPMNHFFHDMRTVLTIDTDSGEFIYKNGDYVRKEKIENIRLVKIYSGVFRLTSSISYYEVFLSDDTQIVAGSFLGSSWLDYLDKARFEEEKNVIMLI
jgi:hypothetical protein